MKLLRSTEGQRLLGSAMRRKALPLPDGLAGAREEEKAGPEVESGSEKTEEAAAAVERRLAAYTKQINGSYCAFASVAAVLKFLRPRRFTDTQESLRDKFIHGRSQKHLRRYGVTLESTARMLLAWSDAHSADCPVRVSIGSSLDEGAVARAFLSATLTPTTAIIVNFRRTAFGHRGGHFCPVGAVAGSTVDSAHVLLLDPAAHRTEPHWVPLTLLARCMATEDRGAKSARGFLVINGCRDHVA